MINTDTFGLTEYGFRRPSYAELLDAYELRAKEYFGSRVNVTVRSPLGIFLRIFAWFSHLAWQLSEAVYDSAFIDTAAGVSLSRLGAFIGIRRLSAQKAAGSLTMIGEPGAVVHAGFLAEARSGARFVTLSDAVIQADGRAEAPLQAYETGLEGNAAAGMITVVVTPVAGVTEVINEAPTVGGRRRETDQEFRERYAASVDRPGGSNTDAIRADLLTVWGVAAALVWENNTDEPDEAGLPPHSIEAIVYGGEDAAIAAALFRRKAAGIQTHGGVSVRLTDHSGREQIVRFSRPALLPVWIRISGLLTDGAYGGDDTLRRALVAYIGTDADGLGVSGLSIGQTVYYTKLACPVNETPGVVDYRLELSRDGETWGQSNIAVLARQKAVTSDERIEIRS